MESAKHLKRTRSDVVYDAVIFVILTIIFLLVAYPLYFVIISSFSDPVAVAGGKVVLYPVGFTLDGYNEVFKAKTVMRGFFNSLLYTAVGVSINLAVTLPTSYALSRKDFPLNKPITLFYIVTMFVGGGMMPTYLVVRDTGLLNTMWALVLPGALGVYNMIVGRTFFTTNIPSELMEAAKLDGCGNTKFFFHIVLPLSGAITAILFLYYGVGHWNSYFSALLYVSDRTKWPLQMELRNILLQNSVNMSKTVMTEEQLAEKERLEALKEMMKYSLIIISSIPVLIIYPFVQKHFVKGVMIGSVKG
ncbi:MAG: carbohydrate ABC transporter permease [Clostridia bacterium]|nr:carbohydrate ABC transporter permease [Clostridia bacterium]